MLGAREVDKGGSPGLEAVLIHRTTIALYKSGQTIEFLCHSLVSLQDEGITFYAF